MVQEILSTFEEEVDELSLLRGTGGIFEITANSQLIWSRKEMRGFPEIAELKKLVRDIVAPDRNVGCIDKK